jgi:hypothetical protein
LEVTLSNIELPETAIDALDALSFRVQALDDVVCGAPDVPNV